MKAKANRTIDTAPQAATGSPAQQATVLIDCDVHNKINPESLAARLPERWRSYYRGFGLRANMRAGYIKARAEGAITNAWPPNGAGPGTDREFMVAQLLDPWHHTYAILNPINQVFLATQVGEYAAALDRAVNDAVLADWLEPEARFFASLCVPFEDADLAVKEIERLGDHPRFVQVLLNLITRDPLGNRKYWPVYEAAVHYDLPVAVHVGGSSGHPMAGCGWPSFYLEDHANFQQSFQDQVISFVTAGVFDHFPRLRIVLQEGGFSWMVPLMWRLDRSYALLREHIPSLKRLPSEYCREHFWFTTQPIEEPEKPEYFMRVIDQLQMDDKYLFATDYPHWDFDAPDLAIPKSLSPLLKRKIFGENALQLYGRLPEVAPDRSLEPSVR